MLQAKKLQMYNAHLRRNVNFWGDENNCLFIGLEGKNVSQKWQVKKVTGNVLAVRGTVLFGNNVGFSYTKSSLQWMRYKQCNIYNPILIVNSSLSMLNTSYTNTLPIIWFQVIMLLIGRLKVWQH